MATNSTAGITVCEVCRGNRFYEQSDPKTGVYRSIPCACCSGRGWHTGPAQPNKEAS